VSNISAEAVNMTINHFKTANKMALTESFVFFKLGGFFPYFDSSVKLRFNLL
jgi:hypothetical protein